MRLTLAVVGLAGLSACAQIDEFGANLSQIDFGAETKRAFAAEFQDQPFEDGTVFVVAEEHGELHTYSLTPCRGGTHICGGSGGVGHLKRTPDFDVVTGAYPNRVFFLAPGGSGVLKWRGENRDLAWN